jgi:RelA/SpoT family (p)ppGpp synthetase
MSDIQVFTKKLHDYLEPDQVNLVRRAYYFAEQAHDGQTRRSGEPYVTHPLAVATILANMHMDHQSLAAALLHDVIEDTGVSKEALSQQFGETVAELVDGVSKLNQLQTEDRAEIQAENFQKMVMAMSKDIRVILVKLADRLHNMRTLGVLAPVKRRRIARETLDIYAPIANRLGIHSLFIEFEELGFEALHPMRSARIKAAVKHARGHRKEIIHKIKHAIEACLTREDLPGRVFGREKHLYSIYQKMRHKKRQFGEIMDVYAFRIVTDKVDTCYRILGAVHNLYKPVPGRFKDYIAIPKVNGYQSIHTVLFGMHGVPIEIQIRTEEMETMANHGIASHWLYKSEDDANDARARQWVKGLLEMQQQAGNSLEFIENAKVDLFPDEIYVFTPQGKIMALPKGATAIDFAYSVHTDVGNACVACKINRKLAPLSEPLQNGETVEIITAPGAQPNPAWLSFIVTAKARSNLRHFLKHQQEGQALTLGKRLLNRALSSFNVKVDDIPELIIDRFLAESSYNTLDELLTDIGLGNRMPHLVAHHLAPINDNVPELPKKSKRKSSISIRGTEGMVLTYGKCCHPIPGDPIIGHVSAGRGMVVHTETCKNIIEILNNPEKCMYLRWSRHIEGDFQTELRIELENVRGMMAILAAKIADAEVNIDKISMEDREANFCVVNLTLSVKDRVHLAHVMKRIRTIKGINKVIRIKN